MFPEFSLLDVGLAKLPVLLRLVDPRDKALALLVFGQVEEEFDDARAVGVQVLLQVDNRTIAITPNPFVGMSRVRDVLGFKDFGVYAGDQHLLVVGSIEDADLSARREVPRSAPKEVVLQLGGAGVLEAEHLAALGIDPRHHVPDGAVLPCRVHRLKDQQHSVAVTGVEELLLVAQPLDVVIQQRLVLILRFVVGINLRRPPS